MLSIVIPVYNEEENIMPLFDELKSTLELIEEEYEIIFVDDGSTDSSISLFREIKKSEKSIRMIKLRRNYGQTAALLAGFNAANGEIIISMDADLQNDPKDIPLLLEKLNDGWDVVCGWRHERNDPISKRIPSKISNWLARKLTDLNIHDLGCTLRAYKKKTVQNLDLYGELHRYIPVLIFWKGFKITEVKTNHRPRTRGKTKYGVSRVLTGFLDLLLVKFLLSYFSKPMLMFGSLGLLSMILGFLSGLYLVIQKYLYNIPIGDKPLLMLSVLLIVFGVQFITTGLLADLIKRTHFSVRQVYEIEEEL